MPPGSEGLRIHPALRWLSVPEHVGKCCLVRPKQEPAASGARSGLLALCLVHVQLVAPHICRRQL